MHCKYLSVAPYKALQKFSKALYGTTGGILTVHTFSCHGTADCGLRTADCGLRTADCGLRTEDCGVKTADCRLRTADCGLQAAENAQYSTNVGEGVCN